MLKMDGHGISTLIRNSFYRYGDLGTYAAVIFTMSDGRVWFAPIDEGEFYGFWAIISEVCTFDYPVNPRSVSKEQVEAALGASIECNLIEASLAMHEAENICNYGVNLCSMFGVKTVNHDNGQHELMADINQRLCREVVEQEWLAID